MNRGMGVFSGRKATYGMHQNIYSFVLSTNYLKLIKEMSLICTILFLTPVPLRFFISTFWNSGKGYGIQNNMLYLDSLAVRGQNKEVIKKIIEILWALKNVITNKIIQDLNYQFLKMI